jgi:hypothetical protein
MLCIAGVLCNENTAEQIEKSGLLQMLFHHMGDKKEDDEFVLQITFTFSKLLSHKVTAQRLLDETDIVYYLVDLLQDKNKEVCVKNSVPVEFFTTWCASHHDFIHNAVLCSTDAVFLSFTTEPRTGLVRNSGFHASTDVVES